MASLYQRAVGRLWKKYWPTAPHFGMYKQCVDGKTGIEIGGPSDSFRAGNVLPVYDRVGSLDNCDFSSSTVWAAHQADFAYSPTRPLGRSFFCDGSQLTPIADHSYDFLLSSHNLEHFANPVKALQEWKRVLRPGGALILILPYYLNTFDHRRTPTPVSNMLADFDRNAGEDDLSHLDDILARHDLTRDPLAGSLDHFKQRSLDNFNNRCLHHHVFDEQNSRDLLTACGYNVLASDIVPPYVGQLCLLART